MICPYCHQEIPQGSDRCPHCGRSIVQKPIEEEPRLSRGMKVFIAVGGALLAAFTIYNAVSHFGDPEKGLGPRTSELALHEGQQFAAPTRTLPREDPSIGETTPSANQRAYAEDAKQLIR